MTTTATAPEATLDTVETVPSFVQDSWWTPDAGSAASAVAVRDASTGEILAKVSTDGLDLAAVVDYGRTTGQTELGKLTFHQRALKLKELAQYLNARREHFYAFSAQTGATKIDSMIDIDGGIGVLFTFGSKGRRELPNAQVVVDGPMEVLSKDGSFAGEHIYTRIPGVAVQINAFNFPVWGMLEKLAPAFIAGVPTIVKPATPTGYVAAAVVKAIIESNILPKGSLQLISGSVRGRSGLPRPRGLHRFGVHRAVPEVAPQCGAGRRAVHVRDRLAERRDPGPGRRRGHAGVRRVHQVRGHRDHGQGRAEVHRDPPCHRAAGPGAGRRFRNRRPGGAARGAGRSPGRGRHHGCARLP
jgi:acyl-CoA reductase-like NAD-dependent aldehyde dehydrogenase